MPISLHQKCPFLSAMRGEESEFSFAPCRRLIQVEGLVSPQIKFIFSLLVRAHKLWANASLKRFAHIFHHDKSPGRPYQQQPLELTHPFYCTPVVQPKASLNANGFASNCMCLVTCEGTIANYYFSRVSPHLITLSRRVWTLAQLELRQPRAKTKTNSFLLLILIGFN